MTDRPDPGSRPGPGEELLPGVRALDHTADLALGIRAPTLPDLLRRAAAGMTALVRDPAAPPPPPHPPVERALSLGAEEPALLLAAWLRELLYLHEVEGLVYADADFEKLTGESLRARVRFGRDPRPPDSELKGVTYHGLEVRHDPSGEWRGTVIFDV